GSGKTNLLEGIYLLSSNRGFRTGDRKELTKRSTDGFFLQGIFDGEIIERAISEKKKLLHLNQENIPANKLRTYNPVITFSPSDIFLATGSSETRRNFFDAAIALRDDEYSDYLAVYERALRQRNASLKKDPKHADLWNETLSTSGAKIIEKRIEFVKLLIPKVERLYDELAQGKAQLKYFNNFKLSQNIEQSLKDALINSNAEDLRRKHTSKGPHRDDISLLIDEMTAAKSGSQGQNRTLAFALKIGAIEIIEETLGRKPIVLIDDALLEVDPSKRLRIFEKLYHSGLQLFLTGTTKEFFHFINPDYKPQIIDLELFA
ncbi:MAG: DNA replication/repair protein RecF, partial [Brevinema sp.]